MTKDFDSRTALRELRVASSESIEEIAADVAELNALLNSLSEFVDQVNVRLCKIENAIAEDRL